MISGIKAHYFKPSTQELLEGNDHKMGYASVIDALTINDENRLRLENQILKVNKSEIEQLKEKAEKYEDFMATFNPHIEEFQREINSLKLRINSQVSKKKNSNNKKKKSSRSGKKKDNRKYNATWTLVQTKIRRFTLTKTQTRI